MKSNVKYDIEHEGTLGSNRVEMRFSNDAAGRAHLMSMLTDLYSDRETSTLREVACNGWDAQIEEGYDGPLEVTLPTRMMPYLVIQDYGTGMSVDFINNEFVEFGTSTKRGTDAQTGFLGIGGKSPLTLTAQFTFTTVHNGVKATVEVSRGTDGAGGIEITDTAATDEPNGTRFKIPIENIFSMIQKVNRFFKYWPEGSVLIDGREPERPEPVMVLDPDIKVYQTNERGYPYGGMLDVIVMGSVPYPVKADYRLSGPLRRDQYVVAEVPMGSVNFVPSRESLDYTDLTCDTLKTIRDFVSERALKEVQASIDNVSNPIEGARLAYKYNSNMKSEHGFRWRGHVVPRQMRIELQVKPSYMDDTEWEGGISYRYDPDGGNPKGQRVDFGAKTHLDTLKNAWVIEGFPNKSLSTGNQEKIDRWMSANDVPHNATIYLIPKKGMAYPWVPHSRTGRWEDVRKYRGVQRNSAGDYKVYSRQLYTGRVPGSSTLYPVPPVRINEVPAKGRLVYYTSTDAANYHARRRQGYMPEVIGPQLADAFPDVYVFLLPRNRWAKFKRENRRAKHVDEFLNNERRKFEKKVTNEQAYLLCNSDVDLFGRFDSSLLRAMGRRASEIIDPDVKTALTSLTSVTKDIRQRWEAIRGLNRAIGRTVTLDYKRGPIIHNLKMIAERYPLMVRSHETDDAIEYVNALYLYRNPDKKERK